MPEDAALRRKLNSLDSRCDQLEHFRDAEQSIVEEIQEQIKELRAETTRLNSKIRELEGKQR